MWRLGRSRVSAHPIASREDLADDFVALTFDDGPAEWTEPILDTLRSADIRATFFVIGNAIPGREQTLRRIAREGHEIGNHSLRHLRLDQLRRRKIERELGATDRAITAATGTKPTVFRPPYNRFNQDVLEVAAAFGFNWVVLASVWTHDYKCESATDIVEAILPSVRRGAIIDLHDGKPLHEPRYAAGGSRDDRWPTVNAVEMLASALSRYTFVTVSELLAL
jgi:peptidoglycan/xylan/chitin deacetylase (PgdA/CDA1 family)